MSVEEVREKSGLPKDVADSLYWKCLWLRYTPSDTNVMWMRLLKDKKYRCTKTVFLNKQ